MCPRTFETAVFRVLGLDTVGARPPSWHATLRVLNTHLDHVGVEARQRSAAMLAAAIEEGQERFPESAHVVTGDFNSPKGGGNAVYRLLAGDGAEGGAGLRDALRHAGTVWSEPNTIHKFQGTSFGAGQGDGTVDFAEADSAKEGSEGDQRHIDWILWRDAAAESGLRLRPRSFEVVTERLSSDRWPSDHYPISATFELKL